MTGLVCSECGTPRGADGRPGPGCGCAARERAAAEDFDPLRIRPYVNLPAPPGGEAAEPADATVPLFVRGEPPAPPVREPAPGAAGEPTGPEPVAHRGRRVLAALGVALAAVAVAGTGALAAGLFSGDGGGDGGPDRAVPELVSAYPSDAAGSPSARVSPAPSSRAAGAAVPRSPSARTPQREPEPSRASPSRSRQAPPSPSATARETATVSASPSTRVPTPGTTLRRGDQGPEVAELQRRLGQLWLYRGDADGRFDERTERAVAIYQSYQSIEGDPAGVYGPETRERLERETAEP
ncbi:peptidoglycan-binding protein [Streptomyces sp. NPDC001941]|uniref:peptidoglycan-binding protein n=1 Tax=Streptomyces sp. NPDC001941 TaxID=3154659 RepID=UPI003320FA76